MRQTKWMIALVTWLASCSAGSDVSRTIGARCDQLDDCAERCLADRGDYPGGFCSVSCMDDRDCPDRARCVDKDGGVCLFACAPADGDADCGFLGATWRCKMKDGLPSGEVAVCLGD